ncbi:GDSL-type esterase/lipase family protein [Bacillus mycoides]|uniref:GDSL-type esterase/lipase family protein n=1 Tax=Bacillus mycoides TaxID=1405 RepID=UPI0025A2D834|nr:GDSL-type esterase/lipase family protein [Bacillus mycoides]MDM5428654.1 GDSL-type esterase/lipase family protein [Bacillus mycoides]
MKTLVCFGDSITADEIFFDGTPRLTPRLQEMFPNWKVVNAGVPGDNTLDALQRIEEDVLSHEPDFVTVFIGTNDSVLFDPVPLQSYKENLEEIVSAISPEKVLLISPAPVDEVARKTGSHFLNLYVEMIQEENYKIFVEDEEKDGLHFGAEGYAYLAKLIYEKLKGIL